MNSWLIAILLIIIIGFLLDSCISLLNLKALDPALPEEFSSVYNQDEYAKSQEYTRVTTKFSLVSSTVSTLLTLAFLLLGGFNAVDIFARSFEFNEILTGLVYAGCLMLLSYIVSLPFSIYSTFVIEERFGFNRTTVKTFILDTIKGTLLAIALGGPLLALILWFFNATGSMAWIYCWAGVVVFSIIIQFLAPVLIMPLFNKFSPLGEGELKTRIMNYAEQERFKLQGIFTMDGSKRSTKLNAFFTGFGKFRKIVFFDTLVDKLETDEIVAVLAHEMGHFKLKHVLKMMAGSILQTGFIFFLLSLVLGNEQLFEAFSMEYVSVYAGLFFFGFLYSPVNLLVSVLFNALSRKHEYQADAYAVRTTGEKDYLISGLKKLCQANLSNLTPHPAAVFLEYTHPPVLVRIKAIRELIIKE
ncbi:M48 family metallopeptidase [Desulfopila sp. IMCC35008]|uniref:M48 family metallopeptidase n=1 Tax=Desulfopila sp. IMCC35008 TaxID=2653858 RepID=UPI0013D1E529|nr:M48 family metallopeptidase [Desulfopila sp. IMCC35008]